MVPRLVDAVRVAGSFTPQFIAEYDTRPNRLYFIYLLNPKEVGAMLWQGYKGVLLAALVVLLVAAWLSVRRFPTRVRDPFMSWWKRPLASLLILALVVLGARGTLEHRPINPAKVAYSSDSLMNALALIRCTACSTPRTACATSVRRRPCTRRWRWTR